MINTKKQLTVLLLWCDGILSQMWHHDTHHDVYKFYCYYKYQQYHGYGGVLWGIMIGLCMVELVMSNDEKAFFLLLELVDEEYSRCYY